MILTELIFIGALLYSSVGHGGASGYLAAMALMGVSPAVMKPTALTLNILVAAIGTITYCRAGAFSWPLFRPIAVASASFAYLDGALTLPAHIYKPLVGAVLIYAAWRSICTADRPPPATGVRPHRALLLSAGSALGFLSGLTGVGGGIFLSPLLLFFHWAEVRVISGIAAAFILVNPSPGGLASLAPRRSGPRRCLIGQLRRLSAASSARNLAARVWGIPPSKKFQPWCSSWPV